MLWRPSIKLSGSNDFGHLVRFDKPPPPTGNPLGNVEPSLPRDPLQLGGGKGCAASLFEMDRHDVVPFLVEPDPQMPYSRFVGRDCQKFNRDTAVGVANDVVRPASRPPA